MDMISLLKAILSGSVFLSCSVALLHLMMYLVSEEEEHKTKARYAILIGLTSLALLLAIKQTVL